MSPAKPSQRFSAYVVDLCVFCSFFFGVGRLLWIIVPGTEVPVQAMQLFNQAQALVYVVTVVAGFLFALFYFSILPATRLRQTVGQRIFGIYRVHTDLSPLKFRHSWRLLAVSLTKTILIFGVGPLLALLGGDAPLSLFGLLFPLGFVIVATFISWSKPNGCWLWEHLSRSCYVQASEQEICETNQSLTKGV